MSAQGAEGGVTTTARTHAHVHAQQSSPRRRVAKVGPKRAGLPVPKLVDRVDVGEARGRDADYGGGGAELFVVFAGRSARWLRAFLTHRRRLAGGGRIEREARCILSATQPYSALPTTRTTAGTPTERGLLMQNAV